MYKTLANSLEFLRDNWLAILGAVAGLLVIAILIAASIASHNEWVAWCQGEGGHVISDTDTNVGNGIDSSGNVTVVTTTSTDYFCISETGGILDIR